MFSIYRPQSFNLQRFFQEFEMSVDKATSAYDNVIIMGDINIDTSCTTAAGYTKIEDLMDIFGFENLIKDKTCHASTKGSSIDIILTNRKRSFKNSCCVETGLSDHHAMILTSLKAHFTRLKPINIQKRNYSRFNIESLTLNPSSLTLLIKQMSTVIMILLQQNTPKSSTGMHL